jgi:hypothetical protein
MFQGSSFFTHALSKLRYALCAAVMLAVLALVASAVPGTGWFGVYYCLSFWALVLTEGFLSLHKQVTIRSRFAAEDRFLGYLFAAPFIWPVRLYELLTTQHTPTTA